MLIHFFFFTIQYISVSLNNILSDSNNPKTQETFISLSFGKEAEFHKQMTLFFFLIGLDSFISSEHLVVGMRLQSVSVRGVAAMTGSGEAAL